MKNKFSLTKLLSFMMVIIVAIGLVGCGSDTNDEPKTKSDKKQNDFTTSTIETKFGNIEIKEEPKRIVALGWGDAETALALGVEPVGASDWLAFGGEGVGPWLKGAYKTAPTILGTMELDYEQIASLEPDLILDVRSSGDQERYNRLSEIATTIGVPEGGDSYLTSYQQQVQMIAKALGKEKEGEQLLKDVDTAFEKAKEEYPQFTDKTVAVGAYTSEGWGAYVNGDSRVDFMTKLGFTNKKEIETLANGDFYVKVADEQLELLDADFTVILPIWVDTKEVTGNALYQKIPSVADGRSMIIDGDYANAFSSGTAPALLWAIDQLPSMFNKALQGEE
ncbi:iron-siderophore ABC transporter substrate-binding protein [Ferdinandcohnia quinoae]|uniref:Iron-siderophore ABC transporter substrate-binding protein n=1 Tax=Fredinandcohnia quinoae TaxID=2918902 RepID=A0AAW5DW99_9BACI|nr:iron-siderophore ABC transporter substrate-binding protein [Fredinandcohnia sp. SECRCQ15]MCH1624623.1 iron-siderophore ABC transporter substrate-binding protein [Fredinandcohnia sp. SECRCQ15]